MQPPTQSPPSPSLPSSQPLTEEQLRQLSPEQLAELQKKQCIFCHLVAGAVASKRVYEDNLSVGILDINPANPGHVLLLPREHFAVTPQMPEELLRGLVRAAKKISHAMLRAFKAEGTNLFIANGVVAGQKAQHAMFHIIPRKEADGISVFHLPKKELDEKETAEITAALEKSMAKIQGKPTAGAGEPNKPEEPKESKGWGEPGESEGPAESGSTDLDAIAKIFAP